MLGTGTKSEGQGISKGRNGALEGTKKNGTN